MCKKWEDLHALIVRYKDTHNVTQLLLPVELMQAYAKKLVKQESPERLHSKPPQEDGSPLFAKSSAMYTPACMMVRD